MNRKILAIGNALVDVIARVSHEDLKALSLEPGGMNLVDTDASQKIYDTLRNAREISGGSAANTIAIAASLGAKSAYAGKTADDKMGEIFSHDLRSQGIDVVVTENEDPKNLSTGSCLSLITPDAQRTMCTHLGAARWLHPDDISVDALLDADIIFLEGYLLDTPHGEAIFKKAVAADPEILALTLSDAKCVSRHLPILAAMMRNNEIDLLFGNEEELMALIRSAKTAEEAARFTGRFIDKVICTHGPQGVYVVDDGEFTHVPAQKVNVVDTTGAGDSLAGTVLWSVASGFELEHGTRMAIRIASEVISEIGARPSRDIAEILASEGYLANLETAAE